jgi:DNA-binding NarL/FixJ family response regulator
MVGRPDDLSDDERAILALMAWHYIDAEIAERLAISEGTVHRRVAAILGKLHVSDRRAASRLWLRTHCDEHVSGGSTNSSRS